MQERPEISLARLLVERHGFYPPCDLEKLVSEYADLEYDNIPNNVDGISLHLKSPERRPLVVVSSNISATRQKFTLAHELGHVIIPWHTGTIFSHLQDDRSFDWKYREMEAEANRFASELLMPSSWVESLSKKNNYDLPVTLTYIVQVAGTSHAAASIQLARTLPRGYFFAELNGASISRSIRSEGTMLSGFGEGDLLDPKMLDAYADSKQEHKVGQAAYVWWYFNPLKNIPSCDNDTRSWREVLDSVLEDLGFQGEQKKTLKQRLNGVISFAHSAARRQGVETIYSTALQRLASQDYTGQLMEHPDFMIFVIKRIQEFVSHS